MPKLAMTQETGTILQWYKSVGDAVRVGEPLLEVMTNKVNVEVESYVDGVLLKRLFEEGAEVPVLDVIGYIGKAGEAIPTQDAPQQSAAAAALPTATDAPVAAASEAKAQSDETGSVRATPAARALARQHGVYLAEVRGTGALGRIHREDVEAFIEHRQAQSAPTPAERRHQESPAAAVPAKSPVKTSSSPAPSMEQDATVVPLTEMRRIIGAHMAESAYTAPHVTLVVEADMQALSDLRQQLLPSIEAETGARLSVNTVLLKAVASVLHRYPNVNATWGEGAQLIQHRSVHLGMAVSVPNGLLVPVVRDADRLGLAELTERAKQVSDAARNQKLSPDDLQGGTFTVSNLGMFEIEEFTPIINQPQVAILGVGNIIEKPVAREGQVVIRPQMKLSLSFDHRALDGAEAAMFLRDVKRTLEQPLSMLV